jgi:hypothetical protein
MIEMEALRQPEVKELIQSSYQLILEKLPKKTQAVLDTALSTKLPAKKSKAKPARAVKRRK